MNNIHRMHLHPEHFKKLRNKQKEVEIRLYDEKRKNVNVGDGIVFTNTKTEGVLYRKVKTIFIGKLDTVLETLCFNVASPGIGCENENTCWDVEPMKKELAEIYGNEILTDQPLFVAFQLEV
jgi:ASC-1-like (ASCH) protein